VLGRLRFRARAKRIGKRQPGHRSPDYLKSGKIACAAIFHNRSLIVCFGRVSAYKLHIEESAATSFRALAVAAAAHHQR